jgi:hypothetical protein
MCVLCNVHHSMQEDYIMSTKLFNLFAAVVIVLSVLFVAVSPVYAQDGTVVVDAVSATHVVDNYSSRSLVVAGYLDVQFKVSGKFTVKTTYVVDVTSPDGTMQTATTNNNAVVYVATGDVVKIHTAGASSITISMEHEYRYHIAMPCIMR